MILPSESAKLELRDISESTLRRRIEEWFTTFYIRQKFEPIEVNTKPFFEYGKIYTFLYDPIYFKELDFFDNFPMTLMLGELEVDGGNRKNPFGINLSYLPPKVRTAVLDRFVKIFRQRYINTNIKRLNRDSKAQLKPIPFTYDLAKQMLQGSGFEFAIRSYRYDHVENEPRIITYEDWWKLTYFNSQFVQKLNYAAIRYRYQKFIDKDFEIGRKRTKVKLGSVGTREMMDYLEQRRRRNQS